jgi:ribosomal protein S27E
LIPWAFTHKTGLRDTDTKTHYLLKCELCDQPTVYVQFSTSTMKPICMKCSERLLKDGIVQELRPNQDGGT